MTLLEALRRRISGELGLDPDASLSSFKIALMRRGVASNGRVAFEPGDITLVDAASSDQARAYSFREHRMVAVTSPSFESVNQEVPAPAHAYEVNLMHAKTAGDGHWQSVPDMPSASSSCCSYIAEHGIDPDDWTGGTVRDAFTRIHVAYVAHGGRVWPGRPGKEEMDALYDPATPGTRGP